MFPDITTRAMNVELSNDHIDLIAKKLAPLARLMGDDARVHFDVVLRKIKKRWSGERYCVSVRMKAGTDSYYAVAFESYLEKAFSSARDDLRKAISKTYKAEQFREPKMQRFLRERQYLELFT